MRIEANRNVGPRQVLGAIAFGAIVFGLGQAAVHLAPRGSQVAAWWPAAGVSVAFMAWHWRFRMEVAAIIVAASALANVAGGRALTVAVGFSLSNAAEALVAGCILQRFGEGRLVLRRLADIGRLTIAAATGALTIAIGVALTLELATSTGVTAGMWNVIPSHAAAVMLIVPLALAGKPAVVRSLPEVAGSWILTLGCVAIVFAPGQRLPVTFLAIAPLVWAAIRLGVAGAAAQMIVAATTASLLTAVGGGPFIALTPGATELNRTVQFFLIVCSLVVLPLAIAIDERERALSRIRASSELFRLGFEEALVGMALVRTEGRTLRALETNEAARRNLHLTRNEIVGVQLRDDANRSLVDIVSTLGPGGGWRGEMTDRDEPDGRRYEVALSRLTSDGPQALATCQLVDVTERHLAERALHRMALHDHLTGLANRAALDRILSDALDAATETGTLLAVLFVDLDDFKTVNDTSGHKSGDEILVALAERLVACAGPSDAIGRLGGDEFVFVCTALGELDDLRPVIDRIWAAINIPIRAGDLTYKVNLSIGVSTNITAATVGQLLSQADIALYRSKADGKGRATFYDEELGFAATEQARLEVELRSALGAGELLLHVQPVIDTQDGRIVAAEALIRWQHPTRGLLYPGSFLPAAERSGLMQEIGNWVLDDACRQAVVWIRAVGVDLAPAVHVNVSARQLDAPGLAQLVLQALDRHELPPDKLVLELTETYLAEISDDVTAEFDLLARHGIRLAADDFGTGYSPLTRITELPVSIIKIDQRFVRAVETDHRSRAIVAALANLGSTLGLEVVAEGVETEAHLAAIRALGVPSAQGFLWHPGLAEGRFLEVLLAERQPTS